MTEPITDGGAVEEDEVPTCATCGDPVVSAGHRVLTRVEDGVVRYRHFCDESCLVERDA